MNWSMAIIRRHVRDVYLGVCMVLPAKSSAPAKNTAYFLFIMEKDAMFFERLQTAFTGFWLLSDLKRRTMLKRESACALPCSRAADTLSMALY